MRNYNLVLGKHYLKELNDNRGTCHWKSERNSFISNYAKENILDQIWQANHFPILLDCTSNISHTDQMNFICRYVIDEDKEVEV